MAPANVTVAPFDALTDVGLPHHMKMQLWAVFVAFNFVGCALCSALIARSDVTLSLLSAHCSASLRGTLLTVKQAHSPPAAESLIYVHCDLHVLFALCFAA